MNPSSTSTMKIAAMGDQECNISSLLSSWSNNTNPNSGDDDDDITISTMSSFTNAAASGVIRHTTSSHKIHMYNHLLLSVANNGELHNNNHDDVCDNIINAFCSKNLSNGLLQPAAHDNLEKMADNVWEFSRSVPFNNSEKKFIGFNDVILESERLPNPSNLISNASVTPCNIFISPPTLYHESSPSYACNFKKPNVNYQKLSSYYDLKMENERTEIETNNGNLFRRSSYEMGMNNNGIIGDNNKLYMGEMSNINAAKPILKSLILSDCKKQQRQTSFTPMISTSNRRGQMVITNEGKKKKSEENSDKVLKKPKHESSVVSSGKVQIPKVKLGDKITALQQIVSPFGKTDTASVLWEAMACIKFLQEQVQLLTNPYLKTNAINQDPWRVMDREDKKVDLKSRGLCLVPISFTSQVYNDNIGPDYSTPAYRGCLYR